MGSYIAFGLILCAVVVIAACGLWLFRSVRNTGATNPNYMTTYQILHSILLLVGTVAAVVIGFYQVRINTAQYEINKNLFDLNTRPSVFIAWSQTNDGLLIGNNGTQDLFLHGVQFPNATSIEYITKGKKPLLITNKGLQVHIEGIQVLVDWLTTQERSNHNYDFNCYFKTASGQKWVAECSISCRLKEQNPILYCTILNFQKHDWKESDILPGGGTGEGIVE